MARGPAAKRATAKRPRVRSGAKRDPAEDILQAALALGEELGWDRLRLREVAARAGVPLTELLAHYRDLDAVADAWFERAWKAMLAPAPEGFSALPARERLHLTMMRWFDALAPHRALTGQMLSAKLYPSHPHHWVPMIFNLSRTIHWLRDAAMLDATGRRRQVEEVALTALFLSVLAYWLRDDSDGQGATRAVLRRRLEGGDRVMARLWGRRPPPGAESGYAATSGDPPAAVREVLDFWFAPGMEERWFKKDAAFDRAVRARLLGHHERAVAGDRRAWEGSPEGCLALCLLLDQVPRNLFRDDPRAFASDASARAVSERAIARGFDKRLSQVQRLFLYLPLEHCEELAAQERCVELIASLDEKPEWLDHAVAHRDVIARFGRFPHRNAVLGRASTAEEVAFLAQPGSSF